MSSNQLIPKSEPTFPCKAIAISSWEAKSEAEISFQKGDILVIERREGPGLLYGGLVNNFGLIGEQLVRFGDTALVLFDFTSNGNAKKLDVKGNINFFACCNFLKLEQQFLLLIQVLI